MQVVGMKHFITRSLLIALIISTITIRVGGDIIFFLTHSLENDNYVIWKIVTALLLISEILIYFTGIILKKNNKEHENLSDVYFKDIYKLLLFSLLIIGSGSLTTDSLLSETPAFPGLISYLYSDILSLITVYIAFFLIGFFVKWSLIHIHKYTKLYLKIIFTCISFICLIQAIRIYYPKQLEAIDIVKVTINIFIALVVFFNSKTTHWIASLPKKKKWRLLGFSFLCLILSIFLMHYTFISEQSKFKNSLIFFLPGLDALTGMSYFILIFYFIRIFLSTIGSIPTSRIVERRIYEIESLTYLNKMIAKTIDFDNLIVTVTNLAYNASGASAVWTEIYNDTEINIQSKIGISSDKIKSIHKSEEICNFLQNLKAPLFIDSVVEHKTEIPVQFHILSNAKSIIFIPLFTRNDRIGTLVVLHNEEYGFERDYVNLLAAFSDNVNIAIENARLLEISIEKEKYKQELALARQIQERILPQKLPLLKNFSISAFSMPADEVGGDYYDMVTLKNGKYCLLIGDVSGKGISAAFYMSLLKGVVLAVAREADGAADLLKRINANLHNSMEKQMFITLSAIVFENENGMLTYSRAGHMPMIFHNNNTIEMITPKGIGIGLANPEVFNRLIDEIKLFFSFGDKCLLFTDGANEIKNEKNEEFGYDSLKQILISSVYNSEEIVKNLKVAVKKHQGNCHQHDDISAAVIVFSEQNSSLQL
jgi:phosphoserine phosphatase RsbU/P